MSARRERLVNLTVHDGVQVVPVSGDESLTALDGRSLGRRGAQTRRKLLDATERLLASRGVRDLHVVDIARAVGTSPATFYQYFRDVEDAVLALAEEAGAEILALVTILDGEWKGPAGIESARALLRGFVSVWDRHEAVLRTRNLAAEEGDPRFREARNRTVYPFTDRFAVLVRENQEAGRVAPEISFAAAAAALVALIDGMAGHQRELRRVRIGSDDIVETTARIVHRTITGSA